MWAGFRTIVNRLGASPYNRKAPVKVPYALVLTFADERLVLGVQTNGALIYLRLVLDALVRLDERIAQIRVSPRRDLTFVPDRVGSIYNEPVYIRCEVVPWSGI